jgi:type IV secretion system protein VirB10
MAARRLVFSTILIVLALACALPGAAQEPEEPAAPAVSEERPRTVTIPGGTHMPLILQNTINTKNARPGDFVYFETTFPVVVENRILIPVGSYVRGTVTQVKRPGRVKGRGELHVRFDQLTLPNGYTVNLAVRLDNAAAGDNEEVDREEGGIKADSTKGEDVASVLTTTGIGTGVGSGIGAAAGRPGTGAGVGAGVGLAAGLAYVLLTRGKELELPRGTTFDVVFDRPLALDAALAEFDWTGQSTSLPGPSRQQRNRGLTPRYPD